MFFYEKSGSKAPGRYNTGSVDTYLDEREYELVVL
jgi:hypothetical protein